jgi:acetylornithine/N-succinyldiaminopimelate aminotransferase
VDHILRCHPFIKSDFIRGSGSYLYDAGGRRYIDFEAGVWCTLLGHGYPRINQAIKAQIDQVAHLGYRYKNLVAEEAAVELLATVGLPDGKCVFLSSGSEATEFAVQAARLATGRRRLLAFRQSYCAAYGEAGRRNSPDWVNLDFTTCLSCPESQECHDRCPAVRDIPFEKLAAFVLEPGSASGSVRFPPGKLVRYLADRVTARRGLLVVDEIVTGLGRTGMWYGFSHYGLEPDIVACGKGLGNGYPVSAVAMRRAVADRCEQRRWDYVQSHQNDPLGCAVVREVIRTVRDEGLVERSAAMGACLLDRLREAATGTDLVREIRGQGLMAAMELSGGVSGDSASEFIFKEMLRRGFLIGYDRPTNLIRFLPALTIGQQDIDELAANLRAALSELKRRQLH